MATKPYFMINTRIVGVHIVEWRDMDTGDDGLPFVAPHYPDKSVQVTPVLTDSTVTMQGSNDPDLVAATFGALHRADGSAGDLAITSTEGIEPAVPLENTYAIRPVMTGGTNTDRIVRMLINTSARR